MNELEAKNIIDQSGLVTSSQTGIHPRLAEIVGRHINTPWTKPLHQPTVDIYQLLEKENGFSDGQPFILDSGCGTGKSTQRLASLYPRHLVIGVDRSQVRLAKSGVGSGIFRSGNCMLLRAELSTFWRLLEKNGRQPEANYLLYPNPYPKPGHLSRRWHGHPVFPTLLAISGKIELRCNWEIYALEFARAVQHATGSIVAAKRIAPGKGLSPFEDKYLERQQSLFSVEVAAEITDSFRQNRLPG